MPAIYLVISKLSLIALGNLYFVIFTWRLGQTPGKMVTGVKVISARGAEHITLVQAVVRIVPWLLMESIIIMGLIKQVISKAGDYSITIEALDDSYFSITLAYILIALIAIWASVKRRTIHDYLAATVVIRLNIGEGYEPIGENSR